MLDHRLCILLGISRREFLPSLPASLNGRLNIVLLLVNPLDQIIQHKAL